MNTPMTITIGRKRAVAAVSCLVGAALLLFGAGSLTGILYSVSQFPSLEQAELASAAQHAKPASAATQGAVTGGTAPASAQGQAVTEASATSTAAADVPVSAPRKLPKPAPGIPEVPSAQSPGLEPQRGSGAQAARLARAVSGGPQGADAAASLVPASYAIPLEVQVASLRRKAEAEALTQSLKDLGCSPSTTLFTDAEGRVWYVVRLGPYTRWDEATRMATRVSVAENVTPMIGPM